MQGLGLLSVLVWLPIAAGVLVLLLGDRRIQMARWIALLATIATLLIALPVVAHFDGGAAAFQFIEKLPWIARFGAFYHLGVDGISLPLIVLTAFMTIPVIVAAWMRAASRKTNGATMPVAITWGSVIG